MYENRIENDRIFLKFPLFLSCERGDSAQKEAGNSKYMHYFEFSCSGFPHSQDKRSEISNKFLSFFTLFLCIPWVNQLDYDVVNELLCIAQSYKGNADHCRIVLQNQNV